MDTLLARAFTAALQLDEKVDRERVATFPLAKYASEHWIDHAKFENVQSQIQDALKRLFNPKRSHLRACIWVHNVDLKYTYALDHSPPPLQATALYYAVLFGFSELEKWLITTHGESVNAKCRGDRTPLHVACREGHVNDMRLLLDYGAHVRSQNDGGRISLHFASHWGNVRVVQLLLEHGVTLIARSNAGNNPLYLAFGIGHLEVVRLLLDNGT